jgi:site-specific recombinase XerD
VLKHSLANHLVKGNVNLALVKQSLGHASIASTIEYLATTDADAGQTTRKALMDLF